MGDFTSDDTPLEQLNNSDASEDQEVLNIQDGVQDENQLFEDAVQSYQEPVVQQEMQEIYASSEESAGGGQETSSNGDSGNGSGQTGDGNTGNFTSGDGTGTESSGSEQEGSVQQEKETTYTIDDVYELINDYQKRMTRYEEIKLDNLEKMKMITRSNVAVTSIILGIIIVYMFIGRFN